MSSSVQKFQVDGVQIPFIWRVQKAFSFVTKTTTSSNYATREVPSSGKGYNTISKFFCLK